MKKSSKAYQLNSVQSSVFCIELNNKHGKKELYPIHKDAKEIFIEGIGWVKIPKKKLIWVHNLPVNFVAEDLKTAYNKYGWWVVLGLLYDRSESLYNDRSYYLEFIYPEILNMCQFGKIYDDFTDKVQVIGDKFIQKLKEKGYREQGNGFYYGEKLLFFTDRETPIHPLRYIMHCHGFRLFSSKPYFDTIEFEKMLVAIIFNRYYNRENKGEEMVTIDEILNKHISVRDRIAFLTDEEIADDIGRILELQKVF